MKYQKQPNYQDYINSLRNLCHQLSQGNTPPAIMVHGGSEYLLRKTSDALCNAAIMNFRSMTIIKKECSDFNESFIHQTLHQGGLFADKSCYIFNKCTGNAKNLTLLNQLSEFPSEHLLIFLFLQDKLAATVTKIATKANIPIVTCKEPKGSEVSTFIRSLAKKLDLNLPPKIIDLMLQLIGEDLALLENELRKLSLIFADKPEEITEQKIIETLGMLKQEHIFQIDQYLVKKEQSHALVLVQDLLERGESALVILTLIHRHCRQLLQFHQLKTSGKNPREIAGQMRLPNPVVQLYSQHWNNDRVPRYQEALEKCRQLDVAFKSRKNHEFRALSELIYIICTNSNS